MMTIRNIAAYKFAPLEGLKEQRARLLGLCREWGLKGTILLSREGINLFVAGAPEKIDLLLGELRSWPGLGDLEVKVSDSEQQPFNRMLVRIKKEIIAFGVEGIDPAGRPAPRLSARELKAWLDEGRPVMLLDTRNDYEVKLGTFKNAVATGIDHFRDFPAAVEKLPEELKEQPIVTFCTGGIRCEKAAPFMQMAGFKNIFQLDGGILKYFEECGAEHYEGECFVFDQRVGVDPALRETESTQCFQCLSPLTAEEQRDERYVAGRSCPYCYKSAADEAAERLARRHEAIRKAVTPLPGSTPYDSFRPLSVPLECDGFTLLQFVRTVLPHTTDAEWEDLCARGLMLDAKKTPAAVTDRVRAGERYLHKLPDNIEPDVNGDIRIVHEDEALIVVNKPAPLPVHASGRFSRNTLQYVLNEVYYPQKPKPAHRLDANTTGLVLMTRTRHFASLLQPQFARGEVKKKYLARVQGWSEEDRFVVCTAPISAEPGDAGSRTVDEEGGLQARTEFKVVRRNRDGTTLLEAVPVTGRTNQIRVHLWHLGFPICGDCVYLPGQQLGSRQTLGVGEPPLCLHSWQVEFEHPMTRERMSFRAEPPKWAGEGD